MGEVWRARDTRLGRFEREARLLAHRNHPDIVAIYGFENVDSLPFLVLGQTLAERIAKRTGRTA